MQWQKSCNVLIRCCVRTRKSGQKAVLQDSNSELATAGWVKDTHDKKERKQRWPYVSLQEKSSAYYIKSNRERGREKENERATEKGVKYEPCAMQFKLFTQGRWWGRATKHGECRQEGKQADVAWTRPLPVSDPCLDRIKLAKEYDKKQRPKKNTKNQQKHVHLKNELDCIEEIQQTLSD